METTLHKPFSYAFPSSLAAFVTLESIGKWYPGWLRNDLCFRYLGCNAGAGGFDALIHFSSGVLETCFILWLIANVIRGPLNDDTRSAMRHSMVMGVVSMMGIIWEVFEYAYDAYRALSLHMDLLHPANILVQPSNADTMGDLIASVLGAAIALFALRFARSASTSKSAALRHE